MRTPKSRTLREDARVLVLIGLAGFLGLGAASVAARPRVYKEARVYVTAPPGAEGAPAQLLLERGFHPFEPLEQPDENFPTIIIDESKSFQAIEGFGGAFTDAAATTFSKLPKEAQDAFLKECFDPVAGNAYTLCRTTIHSSDYSPEMYTYDDTPGDKELRSFSIERDRKERIPFIKRAMEVTKGKLRLYASPWSPPAWMKTNDDMLHGGKLKPEYDQAWADYFVKYLQAYKAEGVPMWGLTVQNEALATQVWESCIFTAEEEKDFVKKFLGPTLAKAGFGDVRLMIWDHNRGLMYQRVQPAYEDEEASRYIWGTAFHWYTGDHFDNVRVVHEAFPDKHLLYTEGGIGGTWPAAFRLARSVILDLNNWTEGWAVWNLILDENNGPRHAGDTTTRGSTIVNADTKTGKISYNPPHYVFGQFSRFIKPGAKRIAVTSSSDGFIATGALNPDGTVAVVVLNLTDRSAFFRVWRRGEFVKYEAPANAVVTLVLQPAD